MSNVTNVSVMFACLKLGADQFILKPVKEDAARNLWVTVYQKKKESLERDSGEQLRQLQTEVSRLKEDTDQAVQKVVQILSTEACTSDALLNDSIMMKILQKLKDIPSYQDRFVKLLSENEVSLDLPTKHFLAGKKKKDLSFFFCHFLREAFKPN